MWADKDRAAIRLYLIYIGRNLIKKMHCNLMDATESWSVVSAAYKGNKCVTLYHDKRIIDNECCKQFVKDQ